MGKFFYISVCSTCLFCKYHTHITKIFLFSAKASNFVCIEYNHHMNFFVSLVITHNFNQFVSCRINVYLGKFP